LFASCNESVVGIMQEETYEQRRKRLVVLLLCFTWHL